MVSQKIVGIMKDYEKAYEEEVIGRHSFENVQIALGLVQQYAKGLGDGVEMVTKQSEKENPNVND